ncbi:MAG: recombinase family protein [Bacteroidales bacterium]|nr:recombinase family protein [Bacteroidales bacterium]
MKEINLSRFNGFIKTKENESKGLIQVEKKRIIGYTRVSSKRQIEGYSIAEQEKNIRDYAAINGYELIDVLGGKYESAKGDFTRKEFKALYERVVKMRPKPFAIAIKFISRFSRSGGGAIGLVEDLVTNKGIHLLETSTGLCTNTDEGKIRIYEKLLEAMKENKQRLERTLPGMKSFMEDGHWLGKAPIGYDTYGKRVINGDKLRGEQEIVLNEQGKHLKEAWRWKLLGWSDVQIKNELKNRFGMNISVGRLGYIWKNPFYAGVSVSKFLDHPVKGKWEAIVSEEDFFKINYMEDPLKARSYHTEGNMAYPLAHFATCAKCGHILIGYTNKRRGISYYKCKTCTKNYNTDTLTHSRNEGINDKFAKLLSQYTLDERYRKPFTAMMKRILCGNNNLELCIKALDSQIADIENKANILEDKYLYENFPKDRYDVKIAELNDAKMRLSVERDELLKQRSNSLVDVDKAVDTICKLLIYWKLDDLATKKNIQELVFPQGISINPDNREVLTNEVNPFFIKSYCNSSDYEETKNESKTDSSPCSHSVAGMRIELMTSGL